MSDQLANTQSKIKRTSDEVERVKFQLSSNFLQLKRIKEKLEELDQNLSLQKSSISNRLRDIYETREINYFSILFGSDNFSDLINRIDFLRTIVDNDMAIISSIRDVQRLKTIEKVKYQQKIQKKIELKKTLNSKENELKNIETNRKGLLWEITQERKSVDNYVIELVHTTKELEEQLEALIREKQRLNIQNKVTSPYSASGSFVWPTKSKYITSSYGWRSHPIYGKIKFHTGIDIAASWGSAIYAACGGVVIYAGWYGGYGNAVIIDHGGGYSSLYGHCSSISVRQGQKVSAGEKVASVGSTGQSTGPHLHFEIRQNGTPVNPRSKI